MNEIKVGRKYFELDGYYRCKFEIDTMIQSNETNYRDKCYLTLQEILDEKEQSKLSSEVRLFFSGYGKVNLTLEQLRKINEIIKH